MDGNDELIEFSTYLASLVHDMKNSVSMLLNTTDEVLTLCTTETCPSYQALSKLQYEAKRVNNNLIQLLTLYKMDKAQLTLNIDYRAVSEIIEEAVLYNKPLLDSKAIHIEVDCPDGFSWFFDRDLIGGVINNVLNNAFRYARNAIRISARQDERGFLTIQIEDDGAGYPEQMINLVPNSPMKTSFFTGGTGLGLYFALSVAKLHKNKDREGYILIRNAGDQGGGCFSIFLP